MKQELVARLLENNRRPPCLHSTVSDVGSKLVYAMNEQAFVEERQ
jgi:hypothetical protein